MPAFDQPEAVKKGIFQIGFMPAAYYGGQLAAADAISLSKFDFKKEREPGGVYDTFIAMHKKINMMLLGTWLYDPSIFTLRSRSRGLKSSKGSR